MNRRARPHSKECSAAVARALRRAAKVARKTTRMHGTPMQSPRLHRLSSHAYLFEGSKVDKWPEEFVQAFPNATQTLDDDRQQLCFRVSAKYDKATRDFAVE